MLAYLINLTIVWALSLLLYELLFKHQTFHKLNRIYLLVTLLMGIVLPLFSAPDRPKQNLPATFQYSLYRIANAKQDFIQTSTIKSTRASPFNFQSINVLEWIYVAGCIIALLLLFRELRIIRRYYKKGVKHQSGKWIIIETSQSHGPFSLLHYIFVSDSNQYSDAEWQIVLAHEKAHGQLFHFFDLALLQLLRICCWFHPLVYVYSKYILLLHEYQADQCSAPEPASYGHFLIAQSMLQQAPSFTHSLNRFSLTRRITMLTRSSSRKVHALKLVFVIPLITVCFVCCTRQPVQKPIVSKNKNSDTIIQLSHDELTLHIVKMDTFYMFDSKGKKVGLPFHMEPIPDKLNGVKLYSREEVSEEPKYIGPEATITHYLVNHLQPELKTLPDGQYTATTFGGVLNTSGTVVYSFGFLVAPYSPHEVSRVKDIRDVYTELTARNPAYDQSKTISETLQKRINEEVKVFLTDQTLYTPAKKSGSAVPYQLLLDDQGLKLDFWIKNGTIQF